LENVRVVLFQLGVSLALKEVWGEDVLHGDLLKNGRLLFYHAKFMPSSYAIRSYCTRQHTLISYPDVLNAYPLPDDAPRDGENILRLACGLVEQLIEFARRELAAPAIRNANSASGCFELAGFGDRDHRIDSVRLAASTVF
jgi:hypothetical protein